MRSRAMNGHTRMCCNSCFSAAAAMTRTAKRRLDKAWRRRMREKIPPPEQLRLFPPFPNSSKAA